MAKYLTPGGTIKTPFWTLAHREFEKKFGVKTSMHTIRQYYTNIKKKNSSNDSGWKINQDLELMIRAVFAVIQKCGPCFVPLVFKIPGRFLKRKTLTCIIM